MYHGRNFLYNYTQYRGFLRTFYCESETRPVRLARPRGPGMSVVIKASGTRCNHSHCGWYDRGTLCFAHVDPLAWRNPGVRELEVTVAPASGKGLGVFASQYAGPGRFVGTYKGEMLDVHALLKRYLHEKPRFVYRLSPTHGIDARDSSHFSRYINHDQRPNLHAVVSKRGISFFAIRPLPPGTELSIDYGAPPRVRTRNSLSEPSG